MTADTITLSQIRRHGWTAPSFARAVEALSRLVPAPADGAPSATTDDAFAHELLAWLQVGAVHAPDHVARALHRVRDGLPAAPARFARLAEILAEPAEWRLAHLREVFDDPTAILIDLVEDVTPEERRSTFDTAIPLPHLAALHVLAEIGSPAALRALLGCLDWGAEVVKRVVHGALYRAGATLLEPALVWWPEASRYQRAALAEALGQSRAMDARFLALVVAWADDDELGAVLALGDSGDPRAVPHLHALLSSALLRGDAAIAAEIVSGLDALGAAPTEAQRKLIAQGTRIP